MLFRLIVRYVLSANSYLHFVCKLLWLRNSGLMYIKQWLWCKINNAKTLSAWRISLKQWMPLYIEVMTALLCYNRGTCLLQGTIHLIYSVSQHHCLYFSIQRESVLHSHSVLYLESSILLHVPALPHVYVWQNIDLEVNECRSDLFFLRTVFIIGSHANSDLALFMQ